MPEVGQIAPAMFWRAFFVLIAATGYLAAAVPVTPPSELSQLGKPDEAEAARFLDEFRTSGMPGQYYLEFQLHALPRRGEKQVFTGRMWSGRNDRGAIARIEVLDGTGQKHRLLVQDGEHPAVWRVADGQVKLLGAEALFATLIPGVELTAFDLQRPYLYWRDATLQSINRVLGRPTYAFVFRAPAGFSSGDAGIVAVRAFFDTQFKQPLQSELLDQQGKVRKTLSVVSLKTVDVPGGNSGDKQTLPKEVDFRNEITRDKTRLQITAFAFGGAVPAGLFEPSALSRDVAAPPPDRLIRIEP
jgi:hypothetical protein